MPVFALVGCVQGGETGAWTAEVVCRATPDFLENWERSASAGAAALILTPEYGLVHPDEMLYPGDGGLEEERWDRSPEHWLARVERELSALRWLEEPAHWHVLADGAWADRLAERLVATGHTVER